MLDDNFSFFLLNIFFIVFRGSFFSCLGIFTTLAFGQSVRARERKRITQTFLFYFVFISRIFVFPLCLIDWFVRLFSGLCTTFLIVCETGKYSLCDGNGQACVMVWLFFLLSKFCWCGYCWSLWPFSLYLCFSHSDILTFHSTHFCQTLILCVYIKDIYADVYYVLDAWAV